MTTATAKLNIDGKDSRGPDRSTLPDASGNIPVVTGNTESNPINIQGLHAVGAILPLTGTIAGLTGIEFHVANKEDGTYAKLAEKGEFSTTAADQAVGSPFITEWNWMKVILVGTVTGSGDIPLSFA